MKNVEQTQAALKVEHKNIKNRVSMPMAVALLTRRPAIVPAFAVLSPPPSSFSLFSAKGTIYFKARAAWWIPQSTTSSVAACADL